MFCTAGAGAEAVVVLRMCSPLSGVRSELGELFKEECELDDLRIKDEGADLQGNKVSK